jgi:hypothetical protein
MVNFEGVAESRRFQVRDISSAYGVLTFDVVFCDDEFGVVRCSESVYDCHAQAVSVAEMLEQHRATPLHWAVVGTL